MFFIVQEDILYSRISVRRFVVFFVVRRGGWEVDIVLPRWYHTGCFRGTTSTYLGLGLQRLALYVLFRLGPCPSGFLLTFSIEGTLI